MHLSINNSLSEWLGYIESIHPIEIELGLERLKTVAHRLSLLNPEAFVFTVAGTNGKGTTTAVLAKLAEKAGKSVGWYTSPHLFNFNERVRVNGSSVTDQELVAAFDEVNKARRDVSLSYFEFTTLAALYLFASRNLDVWVLEVGLGGRLDAVNIIDPDVAVVTNIGLDHQGFLGDTVEQIAREKAGIARPARPVVIGSQEVPESLYETLSVIGAIPYRLGEQFSTENGVLMWNGGHCRNLNPSVPDTNAVTAIQAWLISGFHLSDENIETAIADVKMPGRLQHVRYNNRDIIVDVGHNPHAGEYIARKLAPKQYHLLLGMLSDKDAKGFVDALKPVTKSVNLLDLNVPRGLSAADFEQKLSATDELQLFGSIEQSLDFLDQHYPSEPLFIGGSFYTVCIALAFLESRIGT